jgi:RNA polymerase sigma-70 factor (ECF subfamily)
LELTQLIQEAQKGDSRAQKMIYDQIGGRIQGTCLRYVGNQSDAEEVFHDAMLRIYMNLGKYRGDSKFTTWASRIAINTSIDFLRKQRKSPVMEGITDNEYKIADNASISEINLNAEKAMNNLRKLNESHQTIINLHIIDELSHREIATMLGITEQGSRAMLMRAKKALLKITLQSENHHENIRAIG